MARTPEKLGFRMTKARQAALASNPKLSMDELKAICSRNALNGHTALQKFDIVSHTAPVKIMTDDEIEARLKDRFDIIDTLTMGCVVGDVRSLIISGPAGLGKTFTVEQTLHNWDAEGENYTVISGFVRATGLYKMLYQHRHPGNIIVFDDADSVFYDDVSLNLIKAVCDTTQRRTVSWLSEAVLIDEESADRIPKTFEFHGSVIFITNLDFDTLIHRGHKLAPHLQALVSRSHYIDCGLKNKHDYIVRIKQVIKQGMLSDLTDNQRQDVIDYIIKNQDRLRELSLRMALKIGNIRKTATDWRKLADITCCKEV